MYLSLKSAELQQGAQQVVFHCAWLSLWMNNGETASRLGMGRLIAVHGIRGFKAHGSVHRRQFVYRGFFRFL